MVLQEAALANLTKLLAVKLSFFFFELKLSFIFTSHSIYVQYFSLPSPIGEK